jgi:membrane protein
MSEGERKVKFEKTRRRADTAWRRADSTWRRVDSAWKKSPAADVWDRLSSVDFMNQALLLAAVMLLWLFPNLIFLAAVTGRNFAKNVSEHMGLNSEATHSVEGLFKASSTSTAASVGAVVFLVFAVLATVAVIQSLWHTIWGVEKRGYWTETFTQLAWGIGLLVVTVAVSYIQTEVNKVHPFLAGLLSFVAIAAFFWLGMHLLLGGRVPYRDLIVPAAVTAVFFLGLGAFSAAFLSDAVISNDKEYGPIGVIFIIMTWLLAVGVVFILGPVVGLAVQERRQARRRRRAEADAVSG